MVWQSHLFKNFPQFLVMHIVKGFSLVIEEEIDIFLELFCFFCDPMDVGILISDSYSFSKSSLNIWKLFHVQLKPDSGTQSCPSICNPMDLIQSMEFSRPE